ncbi:MAG: fibronectin type III domain-containing protein [Lachnospiraceae bacterium]|nr:fibronectin type III domain-containing protein [Lachnospiraceae bacterium]
MYKDVGKRILAVMLCICMLAGMGAVSNLSASADVGVEAQAGPDGSAEGEAGVNPDGDVPAEGEAGADAGVDGDVPAEGEAGAAADAAAEGEAEAVVGDEDGLMPLAQLAPGDVPPTLTARLLKNINAGRYNGETYEIPKTDEYLEVKTIADGTKVEPQDYTIWYGTDRTGANGKPDPPVNAGSYYYWVVDNRTRKSVAKPFLDIYAVRLNSYDIEWKKDGGFPVQDHELTLDEAKNIIVDKNLIVGTDRPMNDTELVLDTDYRIKAVAPLGSGSFTKPGSMIQVTLEGMGNYESEVNLEIPVLFNEFTQTVTAEDTIPYDEDGSRTEFTQVTEALELAVDGADIANDTNYVVSYYRDRESAENDINPIRNTAGMREVGTYYYRVAAASGQTKGVVGEFRVVRSLYRNPYFSFKLEQEVFPYTGLPHEPKVTVMETYTDANGSQKVRELELGRDFTVEYKDNIEVGIRRAVAIVRGINNYDSGYVGEMCEFTIERIDLTSQKVTVEIPECEYSRRAEEPDVRVFYQSEVDSERTEITGDLVFEFVASELAQVGETSVTISPKPDKMKNYVNKNRVEKFTIHPRSLNHEEIGVTVDSKDYDGTGFEPVPTVTDGGFELTKNKDYQYTPVEIVGAGKGKIVLKGIGNYTDTREVEFWINAATLTEANTRITLANNKYEYTGSVLIPSRDVTVEYNKSKDPAKEEWITLVQGAGNDYIIEPAGSNTEAGTTASIRIVGQNNYSGSITKTYTISPRDINSDKIDIYLEGEPFYYTGEEYRPTVSVRFSSIEDITLVPNVDYTISYEATSTVDKVGKITVTGIGNFTGTKVIEYHIQPQDLSKGLEIRLRDKNQTTGDGVPIGDILFPYNGTAVEPFVDYATIVNYTLSNGKTIQLGPNDYSVAYENNVNIGTAIIVITGGTSGNYSGEARIEFKIRGSLGDAKRVKVNFKEQSYTGSSVVQEDNLQGLIDSVTFDYDTKRKEELIYGKDYEVIPVAGADYVNAGTAPIIIRSLPGGNYTGECRAYLTIKPRDLGSEGIQIDIGSQVYRGYAFTAEEIKNTVKVSYTNGSHHEELSADKFEVVLDRADVTNATGEEGVNITVKAVVDGSNNFGGANTEVKLIIAPLDIQVALEQKLGVDAEYLMVSDPVKIGKADLSLNLENTFKTEYQSTYMAITGSSQEDTTKQMIKLKNDILQGSAISKDASAENADPSIRELEFTTVGENTIYLHGTGNYTGTISQTFIVKGDLGAAADDQKAYVSYKLKGQEKNYYKDGTDLLEAYYINDSTNVEPVVQVWYVGEKLTAGKDYTLSYEGTRHDLTNNQADKPVIKVTGTGLLSGEFEVEYEIVPCDFSDTDYVRSYIRIDGLDHVVYTGADQADELEGKVVVRNIVQGGNAELDIQNLAVAITNATNGHQSSSSCAESNYANCPTIKVTGKGDRYTGTLVRYFDIIGIDLNDGYNIRVEGVDGNNNPIPFTDSYPFTGEVIAPKVAVYAEPNGSNTADQGGERLLIEGQDYNLIYWDAAKKEVQPRHAGGYIIAIIGKNNYSGNVEQSYSITPKSIHDAGIYISIEEVPVYAGGDVVKPVVRIIDTHRQDHGAPVNVSLYAALAATEQDSYYRLVDQAENPDSYDYSMVVNATMDSFNNTDAFEASNKQGIAQIMAANDYQGSCYTNPYRIKQYNLEDGITVEGLDGVDQTYTGQPIEPQVQIKLGDKVIPAENAEYNVQYANNVDAGTADVTIVGAGKNLTGSYGTTFSIASRNFAQVTVEMPNTCPLNSDGVAEPKPVVKDNGAVLEEGKDYDLSYRNNTNVGQTGTVTIKGKGNYTEEIIMRDFTVVSGFDLSEANVTVEDQVYTGQPIEPKVVLELNDRTLIEGTDYTLSYENNIEPGTATIIINGMGSYGGTKIVNFEILGKPEGGNITVTPPGASYVYTGAAIQPIRPGFVTSGSTVLVEGNDYEVVYENNVNVGTATATVNGKGSYTGSQTFTFQIIGRSMALCQVSGVGDVTYNGSNATPAVTVTDNNRNLTENTDYTLLYLNNEKPGEARILINGQGNYSGCKVVTFNILAAGVSNVTAKAESSTRVTLSWNGSSAVTGYEIWNQNNQRLARTSETSYTISGLNPGTTYQYRVRSYTIRSGQVFYSSFVPVSVSTN